MKCCVPSCERDSVLHEFPVANKKLCHVWMERIGADCGLAKKGFDKLQYYRVCDSHFERSCHDNDTDKLVPGALPTLHLPGSLNDEQDGCFALESSPGTPVSPHVLDIIAEGLRDSSCVVNFHVDSEMEDEDVAERYFSGQTEKTGDESEITIHHPEDIEIVTRYAAKCEQESDDEIILKYPNDDDVIKRYAGSSGHGSSRLQVGMCVFDKGSSTDDIPEEYADELTGIDIFTHSAVAGDFVPSSAEESNAEVSEGRRHKNVSIHSAVRVEHPSISNGSDTEMLESNVDSTSDFDASEHPSDDDVSTQQDPRELNSASEGFDDSCYDSVDADEALRALTKPGCSSPRNHSITVYNLCCDKKFHSSISIDTQKKDSLSNRGATRHREFLHDVVMKAPHSNSFQGIQRNLFTGKKSRNKNKPKVTSRNDNLLSVIHSLEKLAQNVETQCIEARRSLRKNCSHCNILRTGAKLKGELTPLLNSQLSLVKKIRTTLP